MYLPSVTCRLLRLPPRSACPWMIIPHVGPHVRPLRGLTRPITLRRRWIDGCSAPAVPAPPEFPVLTQRGAPRGMAKKRAEPRRLSTPTPFEQAPAPAAHRRPTPAPDTTPGGALAPPPRPAAP